MRRLWPEFIFLSALLVLTLAVFGKVVRYDFVRWDDNIVIYENTHLTGLNAETMKWAFTERYVVRYQPLAWLVWSAIYEIQGGAKPFGFHLANLIAHCLNVCCVFLLLRKLLLVRLDTIPDSTTHYRLLSCAAAGAALWAVHPLRVEAVAWVSSYVHCQATLFLLLSTLFYLEARTAADWRKTFYVLSLLGYAASLLTFPTGLGFVIVPLAIEYFWLRRISDESIPLYSPRLWIDKIPFATLAAGILALTLYRRMNVEAMWGTAAKVETFGLFQRLMQAFYIWAYYLWKPFVPVNLAPTYGTLISFRGTEMRFLLSAAAVLLMTLVLLLKWRRWPALLGLWTCYLLLLVPMLGLTEHPHISSDRYSYVVSICGSILIAVALWKLSAARRFQQIALWACLGLTMVLGGMASMQTSIWRDSGSLFRHTIVVLGNDPYRADILWRLAALSLEQGKPEEAAPYLAKALQINPRLPEVHSMMGVMRVAQGQLEKAATHFEEALRLDPYFAQAHYNLGIALERQHKLQAAEEHYAAAAKFHADNPEAHLRWGVVLKAQGKTAAALEHFLTTLRLNPNSAEAHFYVANIRRAEQNLPEARAHYLAAVKLKPDFAEAHANLGLLLAQTGQQQEAIKHLRQAIEAQPNFAEGHFALGLTLAGLGKSAEAIPSYRRALQLNPNLLPAILNLGWILAAHPDAKLRNGTEAAELAERAVQLTGGNDPDAYDLLAAARAETGNFSEAMANMEKAIALAHANQLKNQADLQARLQLYKQQRSYRLP